MPMFPRRVSRNHQPSHPMVRFLRVVVVLALVPVASAQAPRVDAALEHARRTAAARGIVDVELITTDAYVSENSGTTHVYLRQAVSGLEVIGMEATVSLDRSGRVIHAPGLERI